MTPEGIELKKEIDGWRKTKTTRAMPEALWLRAAIATQKFSPFSVAQFLKIRLDHLRQRMSPTYIPAQRQKKDCITNTGFIELPNLSRISSPSIGLEFHIVGVGGQTGTIRGLQSGSDWEAIFSGWFKASQAHEEGRLR